MDFELSEEQLLLEDVLEKLVREEWGPEASAQFAYGDEPLSPDLWKHAVELGLPGLLVPESLGGAGLGLVEASIAAERCGDSALPLPLVGQLLSTVALVEHGDPEQQTRWLPGLIDGSVLGSVGFVTGAAPEENEQIQCSWVPFAKNADLLVLVDLGGEVGLVDTHAHDLTFREIDAADLTGRYWNVEIDASAVGWLPGSDPSRVVDAGRVLLAADAWGIARRMLETTRQYAITRKQFGRAIGEFQSVKHPIADMTVVHEFSRALVWDAANAWDGRSEAATEAAMLCKAHITAHGVEVSRRCIELMGATGFVWEEGHHLWLKRALLDSALLGSPMELRSLLARSRGWDRAPTSVGS